MRESTIERAVCGYARTKGWRNFKLNGPGDIGKPDRVFFAPGQRVKFIEFKAPGEKLRELQAYRLAELASCGFDTFVVDNVNDGKRLFDE